jgi:hypothetical protein
MSTTGVLYKNKTDEGGLSLRGEKIAFASGIIYMSILIVATIHFVLNVIPRLPAIGSAPADYALFYVEHGRLMTFTNYLYALPVPFFLFFIAGLYSYLRRLEHDGTWAMAAVAAGLTMMAPWLRNIVVETSAVYMAQHGGDAAVIAAFDGFGPMTYAMGGLPRAVLLIATSAVLLSNKVTPRWLGWLGFVAGALSVLGSATFVSAAFFPVTMVGLAVSGAWLLALNIILLRRAQV